MSVHHIASGTAEVTACRRRIANRIDPMPPGDSFSVLWDRVDCPACLLMRADSAGAVEHDKRKSPAAWEHDCETCVYLDTVEGEKVHDLYFHPDPHRPTVIARYGSRGEDYYSGLAFASHDPLLALALILALKRGLIQFEAALRKL